MRVKDEASLDRSCTCSQTPARRSTDTSEISKPRWTSCAPRSHCKRFREPNICLGGYPWSPLAAVKQLPLIAFDTFREKGFFLVFNFLFSFLFIYLFASCKL